MIFAHAQDDLNLRIVCMFEGTVSLAATHFKLKRLIHICLIKGTLANGFDPDQTAQKAASDPGMHRLH